MFGGLDTTIFPNVCEVLEVVPHKQYVYPIFKNGSTSLQRKNFRKLEESEIQHLENIEIFVRNPHERFLSGVQSHLSTLEKQMNIDRNTMLYSISQNPMLNRHFCPQLYWLINLKRYTNASITIRPLTELSLVVPYYENKSQPDADIKAFFENNNKIRFYNEIDEVLTINLINQTVTFDDIILTLKNNYNELYHDSFTHIREVINVVS